MLVIGVVAKCPVKAPYVHIHNGAGCHSSHKRAWLRSVVENIAHETRIKWSISQNVVGIFLTKNTGNECLKDVSWELQLKDMLYRSTNSVPVACALDDSEVSAQRSTLFG